MLAQSGWKLSVHRGFKSGRIDDLPRRVIAKHAPHQRGVHAVTGTLSFYVAEHWHPKQRKIANYVDDLVTNKLVGAALIGTAWAISSRS